MFTKFMFLIGSFLVFQSSVFAFLAPPGAYIEYEQRLMYFKDFEWRFIGVITFLVTMYILVSHYRRIKKSGLRFTRKDFFEIAGKLSLLFGLGYMALVLFDYVFFKYFFY